MLILEGDFQGKTGRVVNAAFKGPIIEISTGLLSSTSFKLPDDIATLKLLNKDERRTFGQLLITLLLAVTLIGVPIAIFVFLIWKRIVFTVGVKTRSGTKFILQGDASDWKILKRFVGLGELESF